MQVDPSTLFQRDIVDSSGKAVGPVGQVYLDHASGNPEWVSIRTGLFGTRESFVPLQEAELLGEDLKVPYTKDKITSALCLEVDQELSQEQEDELYRYYGMADPQQDHSGSFIARTEHYGAGQRRLRKYAATENEITAAHLARQQRGSGL